MVTLRVAKVTVQANHKLRVAKVTAQGTATNPKLRVAKVTAQGPVPLNVDPIPDQLVEAYAPSTVQVPNPGNLPPSTTFSWRQISGPPVSFVDNGTFMTFTAPTAMAGTTVVFGVTAFLGAQSSSEVAATVNVLPHLYWVAGSSSWVPVTRKASA
jgi:hypothetical protein